ncbi:MULTISPECIES: recombinase family protein [Cysteiniphilum]|uniref:DNA recombinase n=2 Tax=Bacteria TaxID=2 RepID=A0A8J3EA48_9GAMM|nr:MULTISPECIES: recombinase family protein [Cysteiniphilum]GGG07907.1 DNA recombinase [Cysteiniphilum litorale]
MSTNVALYARVSSERQMQTNTISSQVTEIKNRIINDGHILLNDYIYIDDGYTSSKLLRPSLERLRDDASRGLFNTLYVHSPDRLARKYAYQYLLVEELSRLNVTIIFLNNQITDSPESNLLLQVQGIISEYERTKILERSRRGKMHAAKSGKCSVLGGAPYGYRYIPKNNNDIASYEIVEKEAEAIRTLFNAIAVDKMSINAATKMLSEKGYETPRKTVEQWHRGTVNRLLRNPAYKGMAAFGKKRSTEYQGQIRPNRGQPWLPKKNCKMVHAAKSQWIYIPVPKIVDETIFDAVQEQLDKNKKFKRERSSGATYLLQGLVVCQKCGYAYVGNSDGSKSSKKYNYYSCNGRRQQPKHPVKCNALSVQSDKTDQAVWLEICKLLENTESIEKEYKIRKQELDKTSVNLEVGKLSKEKISIEQKINRLIDSYADSLITKNEFEPRIKLLRAHMMKIENNLSQLNTNDNYDQKVKEFMDKLELFAKTIKQQLIDSNFETKRKIILSLIKFIEISDNTINVVFKIKPPEVSKNRSLLEDCRMSKYGN